MPHKDGNENRVGNPLSKSFLDKVKDGVMFAAQLGGNEAAAGGGGGETAAEKVLTAAKMLSYWKSNHDRVKGQVVVNTVEDVSVIIPMVRPCRICGKHP